VTYKDVKALFERPDVDGTAIDEHLGRAPEDLSFALNRTGFAGRQCSEHRGELAFTWQSG
jgi:hypothetical protein